MVFKLIPPASDSVSWTETVLHSFDWVDGAVPDTALTFDAKGNLYGATASSGGYGIIFELSPVPEIGIAPADLMFADQKRGTTSASQTVTLNNSGNSALTITHIVTSANFGDTDDCDGSVAAHSSCTINVTFSPTALGRFYGTLTVTDDNNGVTSSRQTVSLSGTGLNSTGADVFLRIWPTPMTVHPGNLITYAFPVWNLGPDDAVHEVLNTQIPEGTTLDYVRISGTPGLGTCTTPPYGRHRTNHLSRKQQHGSEHNVDRAPDCKGDCSGGHGHHRECHGHRRHDRSQPGQQQCDGEHDGSVTGDCSATNRRLSGAMASSRPQPLPNIPDRLPHR